LAIAWETQMGGCSMTTARLITGIFARTCSGSVVSCDWSVVSCQLSVARDALPRVPAHRPSLSSALLFWSELSGWRLDTVSGSGSVVSGQLSVVSCGTHLARPAITDGLAGPREPQRLDNVSASYMRVQTLENSFGRPEKSRKVQRFPRFGRPVRQAA
jgi:hypothetical protein